VKSIAAVSRVKVSGDGHGLCRMPGWGCCVSGRLSALQEAERAGYPDLIGTLGGDGTFLRGVRVAAAVNALVLGVDVGRVSFLTEVSVGHLDTALPAVQQGATQVDARLTLTMRASRPLEIPAGMAALLRYGRGPALPAPEVRPGG